MPKSQIFNMANMSFNAICVNKILGKISEFTLCAERKQVHVELSSKALSLSFF